ncbi:MAG TPA: hypothetical protein VMF58_12405 [Rhizomicrobium sp.]|nr:hypothetical protein [Rhizomicrobium sp.]
MLVLLEVIAWTGQLILGIVDAIAWLARALFKANSNQDSASDPRKVAASTKVTDARAK